MPIQAIIQTSVEEVIFIDTQIPIPKPHEVVIKVVVAASNPKDWKMPLWKNNPGNSSDELAGIIHSVGSAVYEFKTGDRVAAYHESFTENGAYAEYATAPDWTTFHVPHNVSLEKAATVPVAALTALLALYADLKLTPPYDTAEGTVAKKVPILIYGVGSAVGAFAAKFARLSGCFPIIGVAGRAGDYAKTLVDYVVDYRNGEDALVLAVEEILGKEDLSTKVPYVLDAISENGSFEATQRLIDPNGGKVASMLPSILFAKEKEKFKYPAGVSENFTIVPNVHGVNKDFGYIWSRYLGRLLQDGRLEPHPYEVIPGGLNGVLTGLKNLMSGRASAVKYVYRVEDTGPVETHRAKIPESMGDAPATPHPLSNFPFPLEK